MDWRNTHGFLISLAISSVTAVAICAAALLYHADQILNSIPDLLEAVSARLERSAEQAISEVGQVRLDATSRADRALDETAQAEADLNLQLGTANETLATLSSGINGQLIRVGDAGDQIGLAAQRLGEASKEIGQLRADVLPAIEGANLLMQRNALPAQVLGTLGGAKVTLGETAETMKAIRDSMPEILSGVDQVVKNSDRATAASAEAAERTTAVMSNFATASKPLPMPLRIFLQVAPPLAGFAAGAATTYSVTH